MAAGKRSWLFIFRYLIVLGLVMLVLTFISRSFLTIRNLSNVFWSISVVGIMAVGSTFVILVGGIDLSVGAIGALSGIVISFLLLNLNMNLFLAVLLVLIMGALIGFINGIIINIFKLPDFIVTLVTMSIIGGISMALTGGETIGILKPPEFLFLGLGRFCQIPIPVIILIIMMGLGYWLLNFTVFGRKIYAVGGNKVAANLSGVSPQQNTTLAYICSGFTAAMGGVILSSMTQQSSPLMAAGYELDVIASIVIGGASLLGGVGTIQGTFFGALLVGLINNGLNMLNVPAPYHPVVKGLVIIIAVALNNFSSGTVASSVKSQKNPDLRTSES